MLSQQSVTMILMAWWLEVFDSGVVVCELMLNLYLYYTVRMLESGKGSTTRVYVLY